MPTKRLPTPRTVTLQITAKAVLLFEQMRKLETKCTCAPRDWDGKYWEHQQCAACEQWWQLQGGLHDELRCKLWHWPCIQRPDAVSPYPRGCAADLAWKPNLRGQSLWKALANASREAKRAHRAREAAAKVQRAAAPAESPLGTR
jgi:hypothetical protein